VTDPATLGLLEVAERIRDGQLRSVDVTAAVLERARTANARLNCFLEIDADGALGAAEHADRQRASGAVLGTLHGVPLAHKDMFDIAGERVRYGSRVRGEHRPAQTATVIERLAAAGAIRVGALNMAEFALGPTGHNGALGDCRNALDPDYMAGGSSSGSGTAVAAFAAHGSLGSDTGGSVRIPAAANGIVGLKPTYGRVPRHGAMRLAPSIDVIGPLARSVRDCARLLQVVAGHDPRDAQSSRLPVPDFEAACERGVAGVTVGVPRNHFYDAADDDVRAAMRASLDALTAQGARVVEVDVPDATALAELSRAIVYSEASGLHARWLRDRPELYSPQVRVRATTGIAIPSTIYYEALLLRVPLLRRFVASVFARCDVLHLPTLPLATPTFAAVDVGAGERLWRTLGRLVWCTAPFNFLGLPALTVPGAAAGNGMPTGVQLVGRPFDEATLLRVAAAHEAAYPRRATRAAAQRP
jgi:aspartyl-tRNA(Asn)/glutamyl-tRNA(Gln) amidotransferase subunit A